MAKIGIIYDKNRIGVNGDDGVVFPKTLAQAVIYDGTTTVHSVIRTMQTSINTNTADIADIKHRLTWKEVTN